jgi:hypothetical protein
MPNQSYLQYACAESCSIDVDMVGRLDGLTIKIEKIHWSMIPRTTILAGYTSLLENYDHNVSYVNLQIMVCALYELYARSSFLSSKKPVVMPRR